MYSNDNIVLILGAGSSFSCGAPLMNNFLDKAMKLYFEGKVKKEASHFEKVFDAISKLQQVHSKSQLDLTNIESIYTTFETGLVFGKLPNISKSEIPSLIKSLKILIYRTLEESISFKTKGFQIVPPTDYDRLCKEIYKIHESNPKRRVSILTFNYDIALDFSLYRNGFIIDYSLDSSHKFNEDNSYSIKLLKLHGSLNWAIKSEDGTVIPVKFEDYFQHYSLQYPTENCKIPIASQLSEYFSKHYSPSINVESEPAIIPPTWNKSEYHKIIHNIWETATQTLENANYLYIIGYSLPNTDSFFKLLYALGTVSDVLLKKISVYNPDDSEITKNRFYSLLGPGAISRYDYYEQTFEDFIDELSS